MSYTSFESLQQAVLKLGARSVVASLDEELIGQGLRIENPEQVVVTNRGIYFVDPAGVVVKVIVHIVDKDLKSSPELETLVQKGFFENKKLIEGSHKFHLLKCKAIKRSETEGWGDKYKMSRRLSGDFFYRFLKGGSEVLKVNEHQRLNLCGYCIAEINSFPDVQFKFTKDEFNLMTFFDNSSYKPQTLNEAPLACDSVANIYQSDWSEISKCYRYLKKYQCEGKNCPSPDLSKNKQCLHTHHVNMDKSNSGYSNLKALCIYCHANQPNHNHMKSTPEYRRYLSILGTSSDYS